MNEISKAVILARGLGKRMRHAEPAATLDASQAAVADTGTKAMIPIGRPFLDYVLTELANVGFHRVCLIIGPEHNVIREYYAQARPRRVRIEYAIQQEPIGTANATLAAEPFAGRDEFLVLNSDNYYPYDVLRLYQELGEPGAVMFDTESLIANSNIPAERVRQFGYATVGSDGYLADLVEKPEHPPEPGAADVLVSMNCWRFSPEIFHYCRVVPRSSRGEFELPQAVQLGVHSGMRLKIVRSRSGVLDMSTRGDIASVAQRLAKVAVDL